jgi:PAS domain-containing protein
MNIETKKEQHIHKLTEPHQPVEDLEARETGRRQASSALKRSETRYRRLFETAQNGILLLDADMVQIFDVTPFLLKMHCAIQAPRPERPQGPTYD